MEVPALQLVSSWLQDGTYGVNALQASVPRGADPAPPAIALVTNEVENDRVALGELPIPVEGGPTIYPCLVGTLRPLFESEPAQLGGPITYGQVVMLWQYGTQTLEPGLGTRHAYRSLRALAKSLAYLLTHGEASRTRDEVQLTSIEGIRFLALFSRSEDANGFLIGGVEIRATVTDRWKPI